MMGVRQYNRGSEAIRRDIDRCVKASGVEERMIREAIREERACLIRAVESAERRWQRAAWVIATCRKQTQEARKARDREHRKAMEWFRIAEQARAQHRFASRAVRELVSPDRFRRWREEDEVLTRHRERIAREWPGI